MLDILKEYLGNTMSPEALFNIEEAHQALDDIGLEDFEREFEEILLVAGDKDPVSVVAMVDGLTQELLENVLAEHGLRIDQETPTPIRTDFVRALLLIPEYENKDEVNDLIASSSNPEEAFAEIVALMTGKMPEDYMEFIETVSRALITKIKEISVEVQVIDQDEAQKQIKVNERAAKVSRFIESIGVSEIFSYNFIKGGIPVGLPYGVYLNLAKKDFDAIEASDMGREDKVKAIALNMVFLAMISAESDRAIQMVKSTFVEVLDDPAIITKVDVAATEYLVRFSTYEKS